MSASMANKRENVIFRALSNFSIKSKIISIVALNLLVMGTLMYISISGMSQIGTKIKEIAEYELPLTEAIARITTHQLEQGINFEKAMRYAYIYNTTEDDQLYKTSKKHYLESKKFFTDMAKKVDKEIVDAENFIKKMKSHLSPDIQKAFTNFYNKLAKIEKEHKEFDTHVFETFALFEAKKIKEAEAFAEKVEVEEKQLDRALEQLLYDIAAFTKKTALKTEKLEINTLNWMIVATIIGALISILLSAIVTLGITGPLTAMREAMRRMADGNNATIPCMDSKDEIGDIARALSTINDIGQSAVRVQIALDNASSSVMLMDLDMKVAYCNQALNDMFGKAQNDLRRELQDFDISNLIGYPVEKIFSSTDFGAKKLSSTDTTFESSFSLAGHIFDITATPVINPDGERLGTVIEWQDVTELRKREEQEKSVLNEVNEIVTACAKGDFSNRMNTQGLEGFMNELATGINSINNTSEKGLTEINDTMQAISEGDLKKYIQGDYEGMFADIKMAANKTLNQLNAIISDATKASAAAGKGDFSNTIDTNGKQGFMLELAQGINSINEVSDRGLGEIRNSMQAITEGDLSKTINGQYEGMFDEIKRAFNATLSQLGEIIDSATNVSNAAARGDFSHSISVNDKKGFMLELANGINSINEVSNKGLSEVKDIVTSMSTGNLTNKMSGDYEGMFDEIKQAVNQTIDKLSSIAEQLIFSADDVSSASSEIASGSDDLSQRTESQASQLEETAASMGEISSTVQKNAENSGEANKFAISAKDSAVEGGGIVKNAIDAMDRIEQSSRKISDITNVIDEISFQINLLALNAAVEAARAGEAGKGFEVVAAEVRKLSQRSANAAKDIEQLISESSAEVSQGAVLVKETGDSLENIVGSVSKLADIVEEITQASKEQASGIEQINNAVSEMEGMTQQNSALVEQNSAACQSLKNQSRDMMEQISFFNTGSVTTKAPKPAPSPAPVARNVELKVPASAGNTAVKYEEDWSDF